MTYTKTKTRHAVFAADGSTLNWGWSIRERAERDAERHGNGAYVESIEYEVELCASDVVLIESGIDEEHWPLLRADAHRFRNMTPDAGRPSDAMRSAVRAFKAGHLTEESFAAARPSGYYPEG